MIIVILGPDGSGKSTIADMLISSLSGDRVLVQHYAHRFGILPPLSIFLPSRKGLFVSGNDAISNEGPVYDLKQNSPLKSLAYVSWYGLDYLIGGVWLRLKNMVGEKKTVAIFARYFYDYYYQSNNRRLPDGIKRVIEYLVPQPRFIFFLDRDAQDIHDGKPELPVEEILNQQKIIVERMSKYPQFRVIDARGGADRTAKKICEVITTLAAK